MQVGGLEVDVGVAALLKRAVGEGLHLHVNVGADAAHQIPLCMPMAAPGHRPCVWRFRGRTSPLRRRTGHGLHGGGLQYREQVAARAQFGHH